MRGLPLILALWTAPVWAVEYATLSASGIDAKTAAASAVFTTENGTRRFYPQWVLVEASAQSGSITSVMLLSVGTNSTAFDNIMAITTMTGVSAINTKLMTMLTATGLTSVAPNTAIDVKVTTAAIGVGATQSFKIVLGGFYD